MRATFDRVVVAALGGALIAAAPSAGAAPTDPCGTAIRVARADLDQTGLAISNAQKQLATILLASGGRLNRSELLDAIAQLRLLDKTAASILPSGRLQRDLARRSRICERRLHAPSA